MSRRHLEKLALLALVAAGCADNRSSIEILGHAFPQDVTTCKYAAGGEFQLGNGVLDIGAGSPRTYELPLYVSNLMADPSQNGNGSTLSGKAWRATAAHLRFNPSDYTSKFPPSPALVAVGVSEARVPMNGQTIDPGGKTVLDTVVIPAVVGATIAGPGSVVVGVTLEGITLDGSMMDSGEFFYGIEVCNGCLACIAPAVRTGCFGPYQDPVSACQ
jgi:hypothetical protein